MIQTTFNSIDEKAEVLGNCRKIDFWVDSDAREANQLVDYIWFQMLEENPNYKLKKQDGTIRPLGYQVRDTLVPVLLDLYSVWTQDPTRFLAYCNNNKAFTNRRYHPTAVSARAFKRVRDWLSDHNYIECHKGAVTRKTKYPPKIRASFKLVQLFIKLKLQPSILQRSPEEEVIILKRGGKRVDYEDTWETEDMRAFLKGYNKRMASCVGNTFTKKDLGEIPAYVNLNNPHLYRIFSRGSWVLGGRWYSNFWTNLNKDLRKKITLSGQPVCELDYKALHPTLLYLREGAKVPAGDLYSIDGYKYNDKDTRTLMKRILNTMINASDEKAALGAILELLNRPVYRKNGDNSPQLKKPHWLKKACNNELKPILDAIKKQHEPIQRYFLSDEGVRLQRLDSEIAKYVLKEFSGMNIVILPEHDSFVAQKQHEQTLRDTMLRAFQAVANTSYIIQIDKKY